MSKKIKTRFSLALIISMALHIGLIAILSYSAWQYSSSYSDNAIGESIDAIMIDNNIVSEQYQRESQHRLSNQQVKQKQQEQLEKLAKELQEKQLIEQQRLKASEKERLLAEQKKEQEKQAVAKVLAEKHKAQEEVEKAKIALENQQKLALEAKLRAEKEAKLQAEKALEEKKRLDEERKAAELAKLKAQQEAEQAKKEADKQKARLEQQRQLEEKEKQEKLKIEQEAQRKALEEQKNEQMLEDILSGLTSNMPKSQQGASAAELDQFKLYIKNAITNKFVNSQLYKGKVCELKIQLAPDGLLLKVTSGKGDPILCRDAIVATKQAKFPKPKNNQFYQEVKELTIDFKPE